MALMLGIDTGGTFTDAVLVDHVSDVVVASAKSPTTHDELSVGVAGAVHAVLDAAAAAGHAGVVDDIALTSVSTTLATNALVEGHGDPAALVAIGFTPREIERAGLGQAVPSEAVLSIEGGHDAHGNERTPLDIAALESSVRAIQADVAAFAVTAQFSVRNPAHELAAAELIREITGKPVTASHVLSARLDGPRRALTAALNARLLATIARLNAAVTSVLADLGIVGPLMVVRGDGSLVSAAFAAERPIETILSGPAASVIGAVHLAGLTDGVVSDIGGTTTDVAVVADRRPALAGDGAVVGGWRTMVEAVDMATTGLGGDSEVRIDTRHPDGPLLLGPERAVPLGRLGVDYPSIAQELERQLAAPVGLTSHGRFLVGVGRNVTGVLDEREQAVLDRLAEGPLAEAAAAPSGLDGRAAQRLRQRGLVRVATLTPTDAAAVLAGDVPAGVAVHVSRLAADVMARKTAANGGTVAADGAALCALVRSALIAASARFVLGVALDVDGVETAGHDRFVDAALRHHRGVADVSISLVDPVVAIGAPASAYYRDVAHQLRTDAIVPAHAEVANAVGAVVGQVRVRHSAAITQPTKGQFRVHLGDQPQYGSIENAKSAAAETLEASARADADRAGADTPELAWSWDERTAVVEGKTVFVEGRLSVEAAGRPRW